MQIWVKSESNPSLTTVTVNLNQINLLNFIAVITQSAVLKLPNPLLSKLIQIALLIPQEGGNIVLSKGIILEIVMVCNENFFKWLLSPRT